MATAGPGLRLARPRVTSLAALARIWKSLFTSATTSTHARPPQGQYVVYVVATPVWTNVPVWRAAESPARRVLIGVHPRHAQLARNVMEPAFVFHPAW